MYFFFVDGVEYMYIFMIVYLLLFESNVIVLEFNIGLQCPFVMYGPAEMTTLHDGKYKQIQ